MNTTEELFLLEQAKDRLENIRQPGRIMAGEVKRTEDGDRITVYQYEIQT